MIQLDITEVIKHIKSTRDTAFYTAYFAEYKHQIDELINVILTNKKYPYPEYASWILTFLAKEKTQDLSTYYNDLLDYLLLGGNQTTQRNVAKTIEQIGISDYKESEFIDYLTEAICNADNKVALQVYSMQILAQFVKIHPELKDELTALIDLNSINKTAAYHAGSRNFQKKIKKY